MNHQKLNQPAPDPAWDYAGVWEPLLSASESLQKSISVIKEIEIADDASAESERQIKDDLRAAKSQIEEALDLLGE